MSTTEFLWFIFGAWIVLIASAALAQLKRPRQTSFGPAMLILTLSTAFPTLGKAGVAWALAVVGMGIFGYVVLGQVVRISLERRR